jgi:autotransporter-associated beta strand protein
MGGAGGVAISGSDLTIVNDGTIVSGAQGLAGTVGSGGAGGLGGAGGAGFSSRGGDGILGGRGTFTPSVSNAIVFTGGTNVLELHEHSIITGNVVAFGPADTLRLGGSGTASFDVSQIGAAAQYRNFGVFEKAGTSTWTLTGSNATSTAWTVTGGLLNFSSADAFGTGPITLNGGGLQWATGTTTDISGRLAAIGTGGATFDTNGNDVTFGSALTGVSGDGGITKTGSGTLTLGGTNTYTGATTINGGTLALTGASSIAGSSGVNLAAAGAVFDIAGTGGATIQDLTGVAGTTVNVGNQTLTLGTSNSTVFDGTITGDSGGGIIKQGSGTLTLTGNGAMGLVGVQAGRLAVMGSLAGSLVVLPGGTLAGTGTITGTVVVFGGNIQPTFGTLHIVGAYAQTGGTYTVGVTPAGTSDRIAVTGAAYVAGTVAVQAAAGTYRRNTTYTILTATDGLGGTTYSGVTSNLAFLTPSLSYMPNAVLLTLASSATSFQDGARTPNQHSVGAALDNASSTATGDFNDVLNALYGLSTTQGPAALDAIGGQNYSGFSSLLVQGAQLFMDSFQVQAGGGAGGGGASLPGGSTYQALRTDSADACDTACDVEPLWGAWGGGMGAFGTVAGDSNSHGLTYSLGGFIAGLDRKFVPGFRAGIATGFNAATLYTQGMPGTGTSNTLQFALYGEYAPGPFYLDALAGYGHSDNRMNRPIVIPGLPFRMAQGYTTANTFFGQLETGYKLVVAPRFGGFVTPFARLQASTSTQAGFSETGADSLNLTVAQQTTQSLRTVLGAQLGAGIDAPWHDKLDMTLRLGWSHEYADLTRPVTATFAGAPALSFTTVGAQAPRDGVVLGLGARTQVAEHTSLYLRYDGDFAGANTNHVLNAGVRYVW